MTQIRRLSIAVLAVYLVLAMTVAYAQPSDVRGHWAEPQITDWVNKGLASGYADGTYRPDAPISRAEFVALFNRAFQLKESTPPAFTDVKAADWFAGDIAIAKAAGYIGGYEDSTFRPNQPITREEVASVLTRYLQLAPSQGLVHVQKFKDGASDWSRAAVDATASQRLMGGYDDQTFHGALPITRAEAIVVLDRAVALPRTTVYDKAGTYGPETGMITIHGDVVISVADVTLRNMNITGNLTLGEGIGDGNAYLKNVTVKGETYVNGGGAHSIVFENFVGDGVTTSKSGVRIVATGSTKVKNVKVENGAVIAEVDLDGDGIGDVTLSEKMPAGANVELRGEFQHVSVNSADTTVSLSAEARVSSLEVNEAATITGEGQVDSASVNSSKPVTLAAKFDNVEVTAPQAAVEVKGTVNEMKVAETAAGTQVTVAENASIRDALVVQAAADVKAAPTSSVGRLEVATTEPGAQVKIDATTIALVDVKSAATVVVPEGAKASIVVNAAGAILDLAKTAQVAVDAKNNAVQMTGEGKDTAAKVDLSALVQSITANETANKAADAAAQAQAEAEKALAQAQDAAAKAALEKAIADAKAAAEKAAADKAAAEQAAAAAKAAAEQAAQQANPVTPPPVVPPVVGGGGGGVPAPTYSGPITSFNGSSVTGYAITAPLSSVSSSTAIRVGQSASVTFTISGIGSYGPYALQPNTDNQVLNIPLDVVSGTNIPALNLSQMLTDLKNANATTRNSVMAEVDFTQLFNTIRFNTSTDTRIMVMQDLDLTSILSGLREDTNPTVKNALIDDMSTIFSLLQAAKDKMSTSDRQAMEIDMLSALAPVLANDQYKDELLPVMTKFLNHEYSDYGVLFDDIRALPSRDGIFATLDYAYVVHAMTLLDEQTKEAIFNTLDFGTLYTAVEAFSQSRKDTVYQNLMTILGELPNTPALTSGVISSFNIAHSDVISWLKAKGGSATISASVTANSQISQYTIQLQ